MRIFLLILIFSISSCCNSEKIPANIKALYSSSSNEKNNAALALASCGSKAANAVPRLAELIYDPNVGIQSSAAYALRKIDTPRAREVLDRAEKARK